jgi:hypothetical protein
MATTIAIVIAAGVIAADVGSVVDWQILHPQLNHALTQNNVSQSLRWGVSVVADSETSNRKT